MRFNIFISSAIFAFAASAIAQADDPRIAEYRIWGGPNCTNPNLGEGSIYTSQVGQCLSFNGDVESVNFYYASGANNCGCKFRT